MNLPGAFSSARLPERLRPLLTLVNLHYAGAAALLLLNLFLAASLVAAWRATSGSGAEALAQQQVALTTARLQARPLEGLDTKLVTATGESDLFYDRRLPVSYSQVLAELGALTHAQGVKLTRVQYAQIPVLANTPGALTEVRMDASLTGDYRPLVLFLNSLERDRMFFLISGLVLTGQQGGTVGLRLRLTTYLRPGALDQPPPGDSFIPAGGTGASSAADADTRTRSSLESTPAPLPVSRPFGQPTLQPRPSTSRPRNSSSSGFAPPPGGPPEIRSANPPPPGISPQP